MNNILSKALLKSAIALAALAPVLSYAADGTITFNGTLTAPTCTVNGGTGQNFTVTLPTMNTLPLATTGTVAGQTPFSISLTGCGNTAQSVSAYFTGANINTTDGNLNNTGTAANVEVQILNGDSSVINLAAAKGSQNSKDISTSTSGTGTLSYIAQYYSTAATGATPGTVSTTVSYTISYP